MTAANEAPKITIEGRFHPGVCAVFRVVVHDAVSVQQVNERAREIRVENAVVYHCAVYSERVLTNGWQPFEQPSPCAYLPLRYSQLLQKPLGPYGAVLVERHARRGDFHTFVVSGDSGRFDRVGLDQAAAAQAVREICERAGVGATNVDMTVRAIGDQVAQLRPAA